MMHSDRMRNMSPKTRAHLRAGLFALIWLIVLAPVWYGLQFFFYLADGGTLGGYGAPPEAGNGTAFDSAEVIATILFLGAAVTAYVVTYRRRVRR